MRTHHAPETYGALNGVPTSPIIGEDPPGAGLGGRRLIARTDARCPAGHVLRHHLNRQPGGFGSGVARGEMVEPRAVLEVSDDVLDLGVAAMVGLEVQGVAVPVRDAGVIAVVGKTGLFLIVGVTLPFQFWGCYNLPRNPKLTKLLESNHGCVRRDIKCAGT